LSDERHLPSKEWAPGGERAIIEAASIQNEKMKKPKKA